MKRDGDLRLDGADLTELLLSILGRDRRGNNDIIAGQPVDGRGYAVLVGGLERVDNTEDLCGVTAGRGGVGQDQADLLVGVNDEHGADGKSKAFAAESS